VHVTLTIGRPNVNYSLPPRRFLMFEVILQYICLLVHVTLTIGRPNVNYSLPPRRFLMFEVILQYICLLVHVTLTIGRPNVNYSNLHDPPHLSLNLSQIFYT